MKPRDQLFRLLHDAQRRTPDRADPQSLENCMWLMTIRRVRGIQFNARRKSPTGFDLGEGPPGARRLHELPGGSLQPPCASAAVGAAKGFCVDLPLLFGEPQTTVGQPSSALHSTLSSQARRRRVRADCPLAARVRHSTEHPSRALVGRGHRHVLTGAFVIPLISCGGAPVAAQPGRRSTGSKPLGLPRLVARRCRQMNISDADLHAAAVRASTDCVSLFAVRFENIAPPCRHLDRLQTVFQPTRATRAEGAVSWLHLLQLTLTGVYVRAPDQPNQETRLLFAEFVQFRHSRIHLEAVRDSLRAEPSTGTSSSGSSSAAAGRPDRQCQRQLDADGAD